MKQAISFENVSKTFLWDPDRITTLKSLLIRWSSGNVVDSSSRWTVLDKVCFSIQQGEFVGIMGRNGVGKSTILKLISGIYRPDSGKVIVNGSVASLIELGAGFVGDLNGIDNIYLNSSILGYSRRDTAALVDRIVEFSELGEHINKPVKNYSSGMIVRLGFSIAAYVSAPILLFDEVLAVGDVAFQAKCMKRIKELHQEGRTVILVTHDPNSVREHCGRCIVLEGGKVAFDGLGSEGADRYTELLTQSVNPS